jgi:hypothetical protein
VNKSKIHPPIGKRYFPARHFSVGEAFQQKNAGQENSSSPADKLFLKASQRRVTRSSM